MVDSTHLTEIVLTNAPPIPVADADARRRRVPVLTAYAWATPPAEQNAAGDLGDERPHRVAPYVWAVTRISLGFVFLWAFLDKAFGLGFATPSARAWVSGGSPTSGFLSGADGAFGAMFRGMAGSTPLDWLFMLGLLGIGLALTLGVGMWIAAVSSTIMLVFMWLASLPLETNPFLDDHLVYAMVTIGLAAQKAGDTLGLGRVWVAQGVVRRFPFLR